MRVVILLVLFTIDLQPFFELLAKPAQVERRFPIHEERPNFRSNEMIGTACSQMRQLCRISRIDESQHLRAIAEASYHALPHGHPPADERKNVDCQFVLIIERRCSCATKELAFLLFHVLHDELTQLVNDRQRIQITFPRRLSPGAQTMPAQNYSLASLADARC